MCGQHHTAKGQPAHVEDMSALVAANERLVHWVVRQQMVGRLGYADAVQEGRIALWQALRRYDPSRGTLATYAVPAIAHAVWRAVRRARRHAHEPDVPDLATAGQDMARALDHAAARALVAELVAQLPDRLRTVVVLRYGLDGGGASTFPEIGRQLGVTKQRAHQLHAQAVLRLADPATSMPLRRWSGHNEVADYRAYLARRRAWQRARSRAR